LETALGAFMKSLVVVHGITLEGHRTSVSLEEPFWIAIEEIANLKSTTVIKLVEQIDADRDHVNLSSAIRLFVLDHFMSRVRANAVYRQEKSIPQDCRRQTLASRVDERSRSERASFVRASELPTSLSQSQFYRLIQLAVFR
jgi:predicted DNA-binding ribbon-helix-helix protein